MRRLDPMTGQLFNLELADQMPQEKQGIRLIFQKHDEPLVFNQRYAAWEKNANLLEDTYKHCWYTIDESSDPSAICRKLADLITKPPY